MELLKFDSNGSKSVDLKNVPEKPILDFNLKGNTLEILMTDIGSQMTFSEETGRFAKDNQFITYTPKVGDGTGNYHFLRFKAKTLEDYTTYTFCYKVHHCDTSLVKMTKWSHGEGSARLDMEPGIHAFTFTTGVVPSDNYFLYTNLLGAAKESKEILKIEIFGMVKGDKVIKSAVSSGICGVGLPGKGIEIVAQTQNPILGEYMLQGDIPGYLGKIEDKIIKNENTFKINWI